MITWITDANAGCSRPVLRLALASWLPLLLHLLPDSVFELILLKLSASLERYANPHRRYGCEAAETSPRQPAAPRTLLAPSVKGQKKKSAVFLSSFLFIFRADLIEIVF